MEGGDGGPVPERERRRTEHRRQGLVDMQQVEMLTCEGTPKLWHSPWADDEVRKRPVSRHDHRPSERNHAGRRRTGPALARMEDPAEGPGRIVADQQSDPDADVFQGVHLRLGVLDHAAPERPGVWDDDPDLHCGEATGDA